MLQTKSTSHSTSISRSLSSDSGSGSTRLASASSPTTSVASSGAAPNTRSAAPISKAVIGAVTAVGVLLLVLAVSVCVWWRLRKKRRQTWTQVTHPFSQCAFSSFSPTRTKGTSTASVDIHDTPVSASTPPRQPPPSSSLACAGLEREAPGALKTVRYGPPPGTISGPPSTNIPSTVYARAAREADAYVTEPYLHSLPAASNTAAPSVHPPTSRNAAACVGTSEDIRRTPVSTVKYANYAASTKEEPIIMSYSLRRPPSDSFQTRSVEGELVGPPPAYSFTP